MIKKINYFLCAPVLLLAGNYLTTLQIQKSYNEPWFPDWREKVAVFSEEESMAGVKDAHYKSHLTLTIKDLNIPHNIHSFEITSLTFSYNIEFVVFKTWYDGHMTTLNNDELIQAWDVLRNGKALSFWTEGYNTTSVSIDSGIHEIPSTSTNNKFGDLVNWYQIYDFRVNIAYKYLPETEDNEIIEEKIYEFFENPYFRFHKTSQIHDVLEQVKLGIFHLIGTEFVDDVKIILLGDHDLGTYLENNELELKFQITVFGKRITKNSDGKDLVVKLSIGENTSKMKQFINNLNERDWKIDVSEINETYIGMKTFELFRHLHQMISEWIYNNKIIDVDSLKQAENFLGQNFENIRSVIKNHEIHFHLSVNDNGNSKIIGTIIVDLTQ